MCTQDGASVPRAAALQATAVFFSVRPDRHALAELAKLGDSGAPQIAIAPCCPDCDLSIAVLNSDNPAGTAPGYPGLLDLTPAALQAIGG